MTCYCVRVEIRGVNLNMFPCLIAHRLRIWNHIIFSAAGSNVASCEVREPDGSTVITTSTYNKGNVSPPSGDIHKIEYGFIQAYSSGKSPTVEVFMRPHKSG